MAASSEAFSAIAIDAPKPPAETAAAKPDSAPQAGANSAVSFRERAVGAVRANARRGTLVLAILLMVAGTGLYLYQLATPPSGGPPNISEIPGNVGALIDTVNPLGPRQESGYPRIRIDRVGIDLLMVKGDGKTPPVKYEAYTYPGSDHLLVPNPGGGNSYVYAHARVGMFWNLHHLNIGDKITIDYGGGKTLQYRVSELHTSVDWRDLEWTLPTSDDRLTLQTCNGWRDEDPRFIVVALRIPPPTALAH